LECKEKDNERDKEKIQQDFNCKLWLGINNPINGSFPIALTLVSLLLQL
jgi:hypothetical protein